MKPTAAEHAKPLYGRCAFVGSGHDLRCNPKGREIDGYDMVFRANAAQQFDNPSRAIADGSVAGNRTDFRVGCLHQSRALPSMRGEVCIIPARWWSQPFGFEVLSNAREPCCSAPVSATPSHTITM